MTRRVYGSDKFDGGTNSKAQPFQVSPSESPDCLNVYPDDLGGVSSRLGYVALNKSFPITYAGGVQRVLDIYNFRRDDGTEELYAFVPNQLVKYNSTTCHFVAVPGSSGSINPVAIRVCAAQYQDVLYYSDGFSRWKLNSGMVTRMGVSAPTGVVSAVCTAAGTLTGDYLWKYTYVNSLSVESNPSSAMAAALAVASGAVTLTSITPLSAMQSLGVNGIRIYRTETSGSVYYLVASLGASVSTYTDNVGDGSLTTSIPVNNYPPPSAVVQVVHKDRMFFGVKLLTDTDDRNRVWFSGVATPEIVNTTTDWFRFGWDGENIRTIAALSDQILVMKDKSVWELYIPKAGDSASWFPRKTPSEYGCEAWFFSVPFQNGALMFNRNGFVAVTPQGAVQSSLQLTGDSYRSKILSTPIEDQLVGNTTLINAALARAAGTNFNNALWLAISTANGGGDYGYNNTVWYFDYERGSRAPGVGGWFRMDNMFFSSFADWDGYLTAGSSLADGFVYRLEASEQHFDNMPSGCCGAVSGTKGINAHYTSPAIYGGGNDLHVQKDLRKAKVVVSAMSGKSVVFLAKSDFNSYAVSAHLAQDGHLDIYGVSGTSSANPTRRVYVPERVAGEAFQWTVTNSGVTGAAFTLRQIELEVNVRSRR